MAFEFVFNIVIALGIIFYLIQAIQLPATDNPADVLGAAGFPIIIGTIGLAVLAMITLRSFKAKGAIHIPMLEVHTSDGRILAINVLLLVAYAGLLDVIGFMVSTLIYLLTCPYSIGFRKPRALLLFSAATTAVLVGVFGALFYIPLPRGIGWFRDFSYLIY